MLFLRCNLALTAACDPFSMAFSIDGVSSFLADIVIPRSLTAGTALINFCPILYAYPGLFFPTCRTSHLFSLKGNLIFFYLFFITFQMSFNADALLFDRILNILNVLQLLLSIVLI